LHTDYLQANAQFEVLKDLGFFWSVPHGISVPVRIVADISVAEVGGGKNKWELSVGDD